MSDPTFEIITHVYPFFDHVSGKRDGLDLRHRPVAHGKAFEPVLEHQPFQVNEFSIANYTLMRDRGDDRMDAVPVFLNRDFRQGSLFVRRDSDLVHPTQMRGKTIGVREYTQTAGVWWRGIALDEYDLHWSDINWVSGAKQRFDPPAEAKVEVVDGDLEQMVAEGRIDGYLAPTAKDSQKPEEERQLRPIFPDVEAAERDYFARTGFFPINHAMVIHRSCLDPHPELAKAVFDACCESKKRFLDAGGNNNPWGDDTGEDWFRFGLTETNRKMVETLVRYLHEQKFIGAVPTVDSLFVPGAADFEDF